METILSLASNKAATAPSSGDVSKTPGATSSAEQFQTVMERVTGDGNQPASSNKTGSARSTSPGVRSSKHGAHRKSGLSKPQTPDSKSSHQASHPAGDSPTGSNSPSHLFMPTDNPAFLPDNFLGIESTAVSIKTPATSAPASQTKSETTAKVGKVGGATNSTPKAGIKSIALPANDQAGLPPTQLSNPKSAAIATRTAFANAKLQPASAANEVETSPSQAALPGDATSLPAQGESTVLSKLLQPAGTQIHLDAPAAALPSAKEPVGMHSTPTTQPPVFAEELQPSALPKSELANAGSATTVAAPPAVPVSESGIEPPVPASLKLFGIEIPVTAVDPPGSAPVSKARIGAMNPIVAVPRGSTAILNGSLRRSHETPPQIVGASAGNSSLQAGDGRTGSVPSVPGVAVVKSANSPTAPVLPAQIPSSTAGKNLPPVPTMAVPAATAQTGGPNSATPIPAAHAISKSTVDLPVPHVSTPSPQPAGTAVAQQQIPMKMDAKQNEFAGAVEQKLPGKSVLPLPAGSNAAPLAGQPQDSGTSAMNATAATSNAAAGIISASVSDSSPIFTSPAHTLQRTQDLMAMQIVQMHETGTDSLRVVIKPDAGLQLSLQLQQHNGGIEVQARVDRGDYNLLNQHWPELQQQFESRGIRVASLSNGQMFSGGGGEGFRQPSHSHGQFSDEAAFPAMSGTFSPGYPPTATAKSASASATLSRRWETWA